VPTDENRPLRLVKGSAPTIGGAPKTRSVQRRTVTRRVPRHDDPVALLERLDSEPVEAAGDEPEPAPERAPKRSPKPAPKPALKPGRKAASTAARTAATRPAGKVAPARRRWRRPSPPSLTTALLLVALVAGLTVAGVFGYRWNQGRTLDAAHQQALAAAKQTTVNFVSVSASSVDRDLQRITAGATGEFKDEFQRGEAQVRAAIVANKVESKGSVLRAALVSGDRRSAVALVAVDATVKNSKVPEGRASHYRIQVDVTRDPDSGAWLVSRLQFVG
jgi:Mce-associated membrane protein